MSVRATLYDRLVCMASAVANVVDVVAVVVPVIVIVIVIVTAAKVGKFDHVDVARPDSVLSV
jgi:hypothetical protein